MLSVKSIPVMNDNYIWLVHNNDKHCVVVDPGVSQPVIEHIENNQLTLDAIIVTHHHYDHIDGIPDLLKRFPNIQIIGPRCRSIPTLNQTVTDGQMIALLGCEFSVLALPGHTPEHIGYLCEGNLFCGDVLFSAGCGRLLGGTAEQMHASLQVLSDLPNDTNVYCAHEYTATNVEFALAVEPNNAALIEYKKRVTALRNDQKITLPTTIALEKQINPFLRVENKNIQQLVATKINSEASPLDTFRYLRNWKNEF